MKTSSPLTLLAVRRERELVELSIVLYRRLRTGTGCECAEQFTHQKNRETIADIKGLVSAYAALKDAIEIPSEFFTTKILLRISMQIMVILQARTRDPIAKSIIAAHLDATIHDEHERTRQRIEKTHGLIQNVLSTLGTILSSITAAARQIIKSINTRNIDGLDITGPRTPECRDQVLAVVVFLANPKHPQSIHHACEQTFKVTKDGYDNVERLYIWCYRNKSRIWAWVETYRLNHDIE